MVRFPKKSKTSGVVFLIGIDIWCHDPKKNMESILMDSHQSYNCTVPNKGKFGHPLLSCGTSAFKTIYALKRTGNEAVQKKLNFQSVLSFQCYISFKGGKSHEWWMRKWTSLFLEHCHCHLSKLSRQKWYYGAGTGKARKHCFWKARTTHDYNRIDSTCVYMNTTFNGSTGPRTVYTISKYVYPMYIQKNICLHIASHIFRCSRPSCVLHSVQKPTTVQEWDRLWSQKKHQIQ